MKGNLENWMGSLSLEKVQSPLISLAIPGSHDSMTYTITRSSPIAPDSELFVQWLAKFFGFIVRPIVYIWSVTQTCTVVEQLSLGIRYFDIRIATKPGSENFFIVHGLYGDQIDNILEDINNFLIHHPTEIVILDMQHFYSFSENDHERFIGVLKTLFSGKICPSPLSVDNVTIQWMRDHGYQVIIIYRDNYANQEEDIWKSKQWPTPWPQTMSLNDLVKFLNTRLKNRPKNCGFVSQCVLTPTNITVLKSPFSGVKSKCALPASRVSIPWLEEQEQGFVNVAIADFIEINDLSFPNTVISLNFSNSLSKSSENSD